MARGEQQTRQTKTEDRCSYHTWSVESNQNSSSKTIIEVKVRVRMDAAAAGHVMIEVMLPRVKLERMTAPKKFVAASCEHVRDLGEKTIPFETDEGDSQMQNIQVKSLISTQKVVRAGNIVVLDEKSPHVRNIRDGTMIKLDVNNGL